LGSRYIKMWVVAILKCGMSGQSGFSGYSLLVSGQVSEPVTVLNVSDPDLHWINNRLTHRSIPVPVPIRFRIPNTDPDPHGLQIANRKEATQPKDN
jgi:hypothetical protein